VRKRSSAGQNRRHATRFDVRRDSHHQTIARGRATDVTAGGGDMKIATGLYATGLYATGLFATGLFAAVVLLAGIAASHATVRIAEDRGGRIGTYVDKYQSLRSSGEQVVIDGLCASACTIILGAVPHDRICVTSRARLGFHAAWDMGPDGRAVTNREATRMLYSMYPAPVRRWIARRGGLTRHMIFLGGQQLASMYRPCYLNANAQASYR